MNNVVWYDFEGFSVANIGPFALHLEQKTSTDKWLLICHSAKIHPVFMASSNLDEAKCQATAKLQVILEDALNMILGK